MSTMGLGSYTDKWFSLFTQLAEPPSYAPERAIPPDIPPIQYDGQTWHAFWKGAKLNVDLGK